MRATTAQSLRGVKRCGRLEPRGRGDWRREEAEERRRLNESVSRAWKRATLIDAPYSLATCTVAGPATRAVTTVPAGSVAGLRPPAITAAVPPAAPAAPPRTAPLPPPRMAPRIAPPTAAPPTLRELSLPGESPSR